MKIYVASPYSHPSKILEQARYNQVMQYTAKLLHDGHHAFSPIVYAHPMARKYKLPTDALWWDEFNCGHMDYCDEVHVYMIPGWSTSKGVGKEIDYAETIGKRIIYVTQMDFS